MRFRVRAHTTVVHTTAVHATVRSGAVVIVEAQIEGVRLVHIEVDSPSETLVQIPEPRSRGADHGCDG